MSEPFPNAPEAIASLEFHGAFATLLGEEGDGFAVIQPLHHHLVVDQVVVLAGMLRQLLTQLLHFVSHRQKGGKVLLSDLAVKQTLADLSLEVEAAMRLAMQLAVWLDSPPEHQYLPMFSALAAKYWLMRRVKISAVEVMDLVGFHARSDHDRSFDFVGGAAFVGMVDGGLGLSGINDSVTSQLSDDALTMLRRHPGLADAVVNHLVATGRNHPMLGVHIERLMPILQAASNVDTRYGRRSLELTALGLQAAAMVASAPEFVSNLFCQTRLDA
ncbi:MAG: acyl-CoA dehydrogenase family protein, partial [Pseudomonadota bacterium]